MGPLLTIFVVSVFLFFFSGRQSVSSAFALQQHQSHQHQEQSTAGLVVKTTARTRFLGLKQTTDQFFNTDDDDDFLHSVGQPLLWETLAKQEERPVLNLSARDASPEAVVSTSKEDNDTNNCVGPVHAEGLGEQQSPREMLNDRSHPQEVPVATAVPNGTRENKQKPLLFWVLLFATIVVVVVSVSIAVPVSIRLLNGPAPPDQVVPVPPGPGTRSPVAMEPTMDSQMTPSPITSAPDTTDPSTPAPTTPMPVTSPTTTTISFDELAGLIRSRLPSVSFTPTSSPEFRALQWMTETDTNINGLSEDRLVQRFAMVSIGFSISGFNNWHTSEPECSWGNSEEVQCNVSGEVITIEAKSSSFSGSIPVSIGLLTTIKEIEVSESDVAGSIPTEVGLLPALEELILHSNRLTGTIPTEIGNLQALTTLYPPYNRLTGSIPTEIGRLHAQDTILMNSNQSTGSIPTEIGQLSGLVSLWFDNNQLSGSIPSTIGGLRALIWVYLDHNRLVGTVPTEVGLMTSLSTLVLYENTITGFMPAEVCEVVRPWIDCNEIICSCCVRNIARTPC